MVTSGSGATSIDYVISIVQICSLEKRQGLAQLWFCSDGMK